MRRGVMAGGLYLLRTTAPPAGTNALGVVNRMSAQFRSRQRQGEAMGQGEQSARSQLLDALRVGIRDAEAGRVKPFDEALVGRVKRKGITKLAERKGKAQSGRPRRPRDEHGA